MKAIYGMKIEDRDLQRILNKEQQKAPRGFSAPPLEQYRTIFSVSGLNVLTHKYENKREMTKKDMYVGKELPVQDGKINKSDLDNVLHEHDNIVTKLRNAGFETTTKPDEVLGLYTF